MVRIKPEWIDEFLLQFEVVEDEFDVKKILKGIIY